MSKNLVQRSFRSVMAAAIGLSLVMPTTQTSFAAPAAPGAAARPDVAIEQIAGRRRVVKRHRGGRDAAIVGAAALGVLGAVIASGALSERRRAAPIYEEDSDPGYIDGGYVDGYRARPVYDDGYRRQRWEEERRQRAWRERQQRQRYYEQPAYVQQEPRRGGGSRRWDGQQPDYQRQGGGGRWGGQPQVIAPRYNEQGQAMRPPTLQELRRGGAGAAGGVYVPGNNSN
jgi:hypothetical protein